MLGKIIIPEWPKWVEESGYHYIHYTIANGKLQWLGANSANDIVQDKWEIIEPPIMGKEGHGSAAMGL